MLAARVQTEATSSTPPEAATERGLRIRGAAVRSTVDAWLERNPGVRRERLVSLVAARLQGVGSPRDLRTIRRYLAGGIATIPSDVAREIAAVVGPIDAEDLAFVPWDHAAHLVEAWLALHPGQSKRALAVTVSQALRDVGEPGTVDYLQSALAGKHPRLRRSVVNALRDVLRTAGVRDDGDARRVSRERRASVDGRALEPADRLIALREQWRAAHPGASGRKLAALLQERAKARALDLGFGHLERCINGRSPRVRRVVRELLEEVVAEEPDPSTDLAEAPPERWSAPRVERGTRPRPVTPRPTEIALSARAERLRSRPSGAGKLRALSSLPEAQAREPRSSPSSADDETRRSEPVSGVRPCLQHAVASTEPAAQSEPPAQAEGGASEADDAQDGAQGDAQHDAEAAGPAALPAPLSAEAQGAAEAEPASPPRPNALGATKELELLAAYQSRQDGAALDALVRAYLPMVRQHARAFLGYGFVEEDLVQEGVVGLLHAIRRFDPQRNVRLATYARYWIRAMLFELAFTQKSLVRFGHRRRSHMFFRLREEQGKAEARGGPHADIQGELAAKFGASRDEIDSALSRLWGRDVSLDDAAPGGERTRLECLASPDADPVSLLEDHERLATVRGVLDGLRGEHTPRDALILDQRLLADDEGVTLAELAVQMSVSRERVRQLEQRICEKLRERLEHADV